MMNIYNYIRSEDIREYNQKIGHKFSATESAFLVWSNYTITLKEKHNAWCEIMQEMPDEKAPEHVVGYNTTLFDLLTKFIKADNALIDEFYKDDEQAVYSFRYFCKGHSHDNFGRIYADLEYMKRRIKEFVPTDTVGIEYTKKYISSPFKSITLVTDGRENVMSVNGWFFGGINSDVNKNDFFGGLWIDVPTPFRYGDIVCSKKTPFGDEIYSDSKPFVLLSISNWSAKEAEKRGAKLSEKDKSWKDKCLNHLKEFGEALDMTASGYFLSEDHNGRCGGDFYREVMHDYVDLEYYRGELSGGKRVLLPIKYFLRGNLDEGTFVKACEIIKKQEEVKRDIDRLDLWDEWKDKLKI